MTNALRGIHPRLIPRPPDPRPSLAILPALRELGDDFAWAMWYAVWRLSGEAGADHADDASARAERFAAARHHVPELSDALNALSEFVQTGKARDEGAEALLGVSDWALERGLAEPAIQCAEAAAGLVPHSARHAHAAGRASRIFGEVARAEMYYERAVTLARLAREWRTYVRAHLGRGQVKKALSDAPAARAHYFTAARAAHNLSGEKWLAAQTRHDLLVLAAEQGAFEEAIGHAGKALEWYPRHHPALPALAHDLGFLLVRLHLHEEAVPLLQSVLLQPIPPQDQVIGWSTLARAGAGTGNTALYHEAAENVLKLVGLYDGSAAAAFANLARGACFSALWTQAEQYACRSLEISARRAEGEAIEDALHSLDCARARRVPPGPPAPSPFAQQVRELLSEMGRALAAWRGVTWKRKGRYGPERLGWI